MSSKKRMASLGAIALAMGTTAQPPMPVAVGSASIAAISTEDANQLVLGYLEYMDSLKGPEEVSLARMQAAIGSQLRQGEFGSGEISSFYFEGDWITLSYLDGGRGIGRSAILHFGNEQDPGEMLPYCRLSFDSLRDRLLRAGYTEGQESGELGEVVVWLFSRTNDVGIEVSTRWFKQDETHRMCVWTIQVRGNV